MRKLTLRGRTLKGKKGKNTKLSKKTNISSKYL